MQILRAKGPLPGFKVVELDKVLPELVDLGEDREEANYRCRAQTYSHWVLMYVIEGTSRFGIEGRPEIMLRPGSVACFPPDLSHWGQCGPEPKHHRLWVGLELDVVESRHPEWKLSQALSRVHAAHDL